jgi:hypothetical protein
MKGRLRTLSLALIALAATLPTGSAAAGGDENKDDVFFQRVFAGPLDKQKKPYACFVRRYDAAHLARHPLQKVSQMKLLATAEMLPEAESFNTSFRLGVRFRHRPGDFDSSGDCAKGRLSEDASDAQVLGCSVDCDGGGITVEPAPDNKSILVRLDSIRIWRNNKPDDDGFPLSGGADDRVFRLHRVGLEDCRSLVTDRQELAALRRK